MINDENIFGPSRTISFGGNYYAFVIVDDYSRFTWTLFLTHKRDVFHAFKKLAKIIQNKKNLKIAYIRSGEDRRFVEKKVQGSGRTMDEFEGRQEEHLVA